MNTASPPQKRARSHARKQAMRAKQNIQTAACQSEPSRATEPPRAPPLCPPAPTALARSHTTATTALEEGHAHEPTTHAPLPLKTHVALVERLKSAYGLDLELIGSGYKRPWAFRACALP